MDINNRNQRTKKTLRAPIAKPKGEGTRAGAQRIPIFENFFGTNDRCPRGRAAAGGICLKDVRTCCIFSREKVHP